MPLIPSISGALIWWIYFVVSVSAIALPRTKDYKAGEVVLNKHAIDDEPSCEELKKMWRFSKRQSRAAEITNEIPMSRDPFADNIWEPYYPTSRSMGGMRLGTQYRPPRPVYGRVVHKVPYLRIQDSGERNKAFEEVARLYANVDRPEPPRRYTTFRLPGGGHLGFPPQTGSFQHLKELIKTERARELQEQRRAEEAAARAAALKMLENDNHKNQGNAAYHSSNYKYEMDDLDNERNSYMGVHGDRGIISFPDMLAPAARPGRIDPGPWTPVRLAPEYDFSKIRPRSRSSAFFDTTSFNTGYNGYLL